MSQELTGERLRLSSAGGGSAGTGAVDKSAYTAKGTILAGSAAGAPTALAVAGTNGYALLVDSTQTTGLKWGALPGGGDMAAATYDPANVAEQLTGTAAVQTLANKTLTTPVIATFYQDAGKTKLITVPAASETLASTGNIATHAALTASVHGIAAGSAIATTADIASHSSATASVHGIAAGSAFATTAGVLMKTLLTAKGDLIAGSAANTPIVIPVGGTAGYVLTVNGATDAGMSWAAPGAGTPSGTAVAATAYGIAAAAGTSSEYSRGDHTHGSVADLVSGTAHATLATGVHGAGTANIATTSDITTHAGVKASVHGITIAETLTTVGSFPITFTATEATSVTLPATGTLANTANIATHSAATAGVHGIAAGSAIATTAEIATHAALTGNTHGVANGSTFASSADVVVKLPKQLVENDPLWLDATLSATGKYSGIAQTAVADAACSFGQLVYLKAGSTRWALAGAGTGMSNRLGMVITAATGAADTIAVLTYGNISSTVFPSMAVGGPVYGGVPAGTISGTAAGTAGQYVRVIGHANAAAELHFAPDNTWVELA